MKYYEKSTQILTFRERHNLVIDPYLWASCFEEGRGKTKEEIKALILDEVAKGEKKIKRQRDGRPVIGANELSKQCFHKRYKSRTYERRSICISSCPLLREQFVAEYREFVRLCREAWLNFKETRGPAIWPPGAFPPARVVFGSCLIL